MADQKILFEIYLENGEFKTRAKETSDSLDKVGNSAKKSKGPFDSLKASWVSVAASAGALYMVFSKVVDILSESVKAASKLQETQNKFNTVFKDSSVKAKEFSDTLQKSYGMAKEEAMSFLAGTGDILTGIGMQSDKALELANSAAQLGADLASFSNVEGGTERAVQALTSALTGEREALKAYGIVVSEEMITAELRKKQKSNLTGLALQQAKAEATLSIAMSQSKNAIGDTQRSFDSYANVQRRVDSQIKDISASIGEKLLPALSNLGGAFLKSSESQGAFIKMFDGVFEIINALINAIAMAMGGVEGMPPIISKVLSVLTWIFYPIKLEFMALMKIAEFVNKMAGKKPSSPEANTLQTNPNVTSKKLPIQPVSIPKKEKSQKEKPVEADMGAYYASIGDVSGQQKIAMEKEIANVQAAYNQKKISHEEFESAKNSITEKYQKQAMDAFQKDLEDKMGKYQKFTGGFTQLSGQLSQIISMSASNQTANVDNEATAQMDKINARYQAEIDAVNNSSATEEEKNAKLKAIDEKKAREEKAIQDAATKEKKKIAREAAEMQKKIAIFETTIEIPTAAFQAYSSAQVLPFPASAIVGGAMATAATVLGLAKLKMIQQQPLPAYAAGTWAVPYDMTAQIHQGEKIIPKTFAQSIDSGEITIGKGGGSNGNTIIVQGSIIDAQGLLNIVDDLQEGRAKNMGASKYTTKSPY